MPQAATNEADILGESFCKEEISRWEPHFRLLRQDINLNIAKVAADAADAADAATYVRK